MFDSYAKMCCKCYHIIFSTFSSKFKCKICVQKEVIHNFKNHVTIYELTHFKKMVRVEKPNDYYFGILFTVGNVDQDIGRHSGRYSGRQSVDSRLTVGR